MSVSKTDGVRGTLIWNLHFRSRQITAETHTGIHLPWVGSSTGIPFTPETGQILIFPAWIAARL